MYCLFHIALVYVKVFYDLLCQMLFLRSLETPKIAKTFAKFIFSEKSLSLTENVQFIFLRNPLKIIGLCLSHENIKKHCHKKLN